MAQEIEIEIIEELTDICDAYVHLAVIIGTGDAENVLRVLTVLNRQFELTMAKINDEGK